jgi:hypothetical protein
VSDAFSGCGASLTLGYFGAVGGGEYVSLREGVDFAEEGGRRAWSLPNLNDAAVESYRLDTSTFLRVATITSLTKAGLAMRFIALGVELQTTLNFGQNFGGADEKGCCWCW